MAKIRHNNIIDTVDEVLSVASEKGVVHLYAEDNALNGRHLTFQGKETLHFGTCGYLGIEQHPAVKAASIAAIERFGTQFPMSKTYVSNPLYTELEALIQKMYGAPVVISKNCTLSHLATIPVVVRNNDLVILDHQVHSSVQEVTKKLLSAGVHVEMIRHNNLEMLEHYIKKYRNKYRKIWYMADGVYSMYGDFAPIKEMIALAEKYEQLYLYVDDAHGMSWAGPHGTGYVMQEMDGVLYRKMILTATMGKGFGSCGGLTLFPDQEWHRKVKMFGGPLTFSVQLEPAILGASVASAKIHLSEEIIQLQQQLQANIAHFNELVTQTTLPLIAENNSPIGYIGTGVMAMSNTLIKRLIDDGIYVNLAAFPAVPASRTGVRITMSNHVTEEDITTLVEKLDFHYHEAMEEVGQTKEKILKNFKLKAPKDKPEAEKIVSPVQEETFKVNVYTTIEQVDANVWDHFLGHRGMYNWEGLRFLEASFTQNEKPEDCWDFRYYVITDRDQKPVLITFAVIALYKEDMFLDASISRKMEEKRQVDPYYFTSKSIIMGSLFTEGDHLYLDRSTDQWKEALSLLMETLNQEQEQVEAKNILLRDFAESDVELQEYMIEQGYVKVDMPASCVVEDLSWQTEEGFMDTLTKRGKRHFKQEIKRYEDLFEVEVKEFLSEEELNRGIELFKNVKAKNTAINSFDFPDKVFNQMNVDPNWEFILLRLKEGVSDERQFVAVCFCHKNTFSKTYSFMLIGMDYDYVYEYGVYRQALYQTVRRANELGFEKANFGISAAIEKKKVGAKPYPKVAFMNAQDNYMLEAMSATMLVNKEG
ncbi:bifunctional aminotransferase class I/II-fold pyridoxal phosphate-dependent enzyme/GNAT family N-acetyltransferase [Algivirga pacifica]|uniref:BioF2-like acetyltransferase domain-containing protein n=1 Tax=Algivirga pacifica TaxID=1162670 RepID=A0ABP9DG74_9BACT